MRLLAAFLAAAAVVLGIWWLWGGGMEARFTLEGTIRWMESAGPWAWAAGIGLLAADLVLPVPGTVVISALGFIYGTWLGGAIAAAGLMLAGLTGYAIGRLCGEKNARRWLGARDYDRGRRLFTRGGGWVVAVSRALPILPEVISCMAGLLRMPLPRFLTALACGSLPMGFAFAAIGRAGQTSPGMALALSLILPAGLWLVAGACHRRWEIGSPAKRLMGGSAGHRDHDGHEGAGE